MQMSVSYCSFGGRVLYENRGGVESSYARDPVGNTTALLDMRGNQTDSWTYWPYGEVQTHTGSSTTPFTFVGTLGYFVDFANMLYVRARHLKADLTRWITVDPLWPHGSSYGYSSGGRLKTAARIATVTGERPYGYANSAPTVYVDPSGMAPEPCKPQKTCVDLLGDHVPPYMIGPYLNCLRELEDGADPLSVSECFDKLPNNFKSQLQGNLCAYLGCITAATTGHPKVDPCGIDAHSIECCQSNYMSDVCNCIATKSNNVGLGACLGLAHTKSINCLSVGEA